MLFVGKSLRRYLGSNVKSMQKTLDHNCVAQGSQDLTNSQLQNIRGPENCVQKSLMLFSFQLQVHPLL